MNDPISPKSPIRDGKHGHDQNPKKLKADIMEGFAEFSKVAEVMRMVEPAANLKGKLITDFIKFRHLMAHKGVDSVDIVFAQMVNAFVMYCRNLLGFSQISHQPKSTENMCKSFARMADINVVVCAGWFLTLLNNDKVEMSKIKIWMKKLVKGSSFSDCKFTVGSNDITVTDKNGENTFDIDWVDKLTEHVRQSSVSYTDEEEIEFKDLYNSVNILINI